MFLRPVYTRLQEVASCCNLQLVATFFRCLHMKKKCDLPRHLAAISRMKLQCFQREFCITWRQYSWNPDINSEGNQKIIQHIGSSLYPGSIISGFHCKNSGDGNKYANPYISCLTSRRTTGSCFAITSLSSCQSQILKSEREVPRN